MKVDNVKPNRKRKEKNQKQHCNCVGIVNETELSIDISARFLQATKKFKLENGVLDAI